jgi:hypothetical protein
MDQIYKNCGFAELKNVFSYTWFYLFLKNALANAFQDIGGLVIRGLKICEN